MAHFNSTETNRLDQLRELSVQKEQEWRDTFNLRIATLESTCSKQEEELRNERTRYEKLKEDFLYNLRLLNERDRELQGYDATFAEMRAALLDRDAQLSELHVTADKLEQQVHAERQHAAEQQQTMTTRFDEQFAALESARNETERRYSTVQSELDVAKRRMEQLRIDLECKSESERTQTRLDFERLLGEAERKHRDALVSAELVAAQSDAHAKQLESDTAVLRSEIVSLRERLEAALGDVDNTRRHAAHNQWLATDSQRAIETLRGDWQRELDSLRTQLQTDTARFASELAERERRFETERADQVRHTRDLEQRVATLSEAATQREADFVARERELLTQLDVSQNELRLKEQQLSDAARHRAEDRAAHEAALRRADAELRSAKSDSTRIDTERFRMRDMVERLEAELRKAREREAQFDAQVAALERERNALVKASTQADFAFDSAKHVRIRTQEPQSEPEWEQEVKVKEGGENTDMVARSEYDELLTTNAKLVRTVRAMRSELEAIRNVNVPQKRTPESHDANSAAETDGNLGKPPQIVDAGLAEFVERLTNELEALRREKVSAVTQCRKQAARVAHLERACHQLERVPREQRNAVEQLEYALSTQRRRFEAELGALRSDAERTALRLTEAQRDADSFHKEMLASQSESAALRQELADSKLQLAARSGGSHIQFGAPELTIEQLKAECARLRALLVAHQQHGAATNQGQDGRVRIDETAVNLEGINKGGSLLDITRESAEPEVHLRVENEYDATELRTQLQRALQRIRQLQAERAHLLEMGNRLRSRLKQAEAASSSVAGLSAVAGAGAGLSSEPEREQVADLIRGKLRELEAMQYALTTRQLAAARQAVAKTDNDAEPDAPVSTRGDTDRRNPKKRVSEAAANRPRRGILTSSIDTETEPARPPSRSQQMRNSAQLLASVSSIGAESLSGVWRMLDDQPSFNTPRSPSRRGNETDRGKSERTDEDEPERDQPADQRQGLAVSGRAIQPDDRTPRQRNAPSSRTASKSAPSGANKKAFVRNWSKPN